MSIRRRTDVSSEHVVGLVPRKSRSARTHRGPGRSLGCGEASTSGSVRRIRSRRGTGRSWLPSIRSATSSTRSGTARAAVVRATRSALVPDSRRLGRAAWHPPGRDLERPPAASRRGPGRAVLRPRVAAVAGRRGRARSLFRWPIVQGRATRGRRSGERAGERMGGR